MRWFWIDKFVEFESGCRAVAVKNVSLSEDLVADYVPGYPLMPGTLIVEGVAQTGGLLVAETSEFRQKVILAKISRLEFHGHARPGDTLRYTTTIEQLESSGGIVSGTCHIEDQLQATMQLFFAHLHNGFDGELYEPADLLRMLRSWRLFEVGRDREGRRLKIPDRLLAADCQAEDGWTVASAACRSGSEK